MGGATPDRRVFFFVGRFVCGSGGERSGWEGGDLLLKCHHIPPPPHPTDLREAVNVYGGARRYFHGSGVTETVKRGPHTALGASEACRFQVAISSPRAVHGPQELARSNNALQVAYQDVRFEKVKFESGRTRSVSGFLFGAAV